MNRVYEELVSVQEALDALPDSVSQLAAFLEMQGCVGRRANPWHCPLANYVKQQTGCSVVVSPHAVAVAGSEKEIFATSQAMYDFILAFDNGRYCSLLEESVHDNADV